MLNESLVLEYVKAELGFPFQPLEFDDSEILKYIQNFTIPTFSHYAPQKQKMNLSFINPRSQVPGRSNEFYLEEPNGIEILNVVGMYLDQSNYIIHGHPPISSFSQKGLEQWALDVHTSMTQKMFSMWDYTYEFSHPNILRISPTPTPTYNNCAIEYERMQPKDFRGIPNDLRTLFLELCLADTMIRVGRVRKRYGDGQLRTPFGEIPLSAEILEEGKEKRREVIEMLEKCTPNLVIDFG